MDKTSKIFELHQVSRIYQMGEVEVRALEDVELDIYQGEFTASWVPVVRVKAPCSICWEGWIGLPGPIQFQVRRSRPAATMN